MDQFVSAHQVSPRIVLVKKPSYLTAIRNGITSLTFVAMKTKA